MLALKLFLVPAFLLGVSLTGRWFGPSVAGWVAGLPLITGPILLILALEMGQAFAASAAVASTAAVCASVAFSLSYAHVASRPRPWPIALGAALLAWFVAALAVAQLPSNLVLATVMAVLALTLARRLFPPGGSARGRALSAPELAVRMAAGALLTLAVSASAASLGSAWSGIFAVFPLLGSLLAVFSHRADGKAFVSALLRGMALGLYGFVAFCAVLAWTLPSLSIEAAFGLALLANLVVQAATQRLVGAPPAPEVNVR